MLDLRSRFAALFPFVVAVVLCVVSPALAQQERVAVNGTVTDEATKKPIANATVRFVGPETVEVTSGKDGSFSTTLAAGLYQLSASAKGFKLATDTSVIAVNQPLNVTVQLSAVNLKEIGHVTVGTDPHPFNITPAAIDRITAEEIRQQGQIGITRFLNEIPGVAALQGAISPGANSLFSTKPVSNPINPVAVSIRGAQPYQSANLYDGHRLISNPDFAGTSGAFNYANLDPYAFLSMDVVRGPGAASPTINNAIGGYINVEPGVPTGPPSGSVSVGTDGLGGLNTHYSFMGQTPNKRVGISLVASSLTSPGQVYAGFPLAAPSTFSGYNSLNGQPYTCPSFGANACTSRTVLLPPTVQGFFPGNTTTKAIICCYYSNTPDFYNIQQRSVNFKYDVAPTVEVRLRYWLNNQADVYSQSPQPYTFQAPAGYTGHYQTGDVFFASGGPYTNPFHELDWFYEYDIRARIGAGSFRFSYASNKSQQIFNINANAPTLSTTYDGLAIVNGAPTVFSGQTVQLGAPANLQSGIYWKLAHDFVGEFTYPLGHATYLGVSLNSTLSQEALQILTPTFTSNGYQGFNERFDSLRFRFDSIINEHLRSTLSVYTNGYHYHVLDPFDSTGKRFVNTYSPYTAPRLGLEWQPHRDVAVRASVGSGISPIDFTNFAGSNFPANPAPDNPAKPSFYFQVLNNTALKPETSFGEDIGASLRLPDGRSTFSLDVYHTLLHNQFASSFVPNGSYLGLPFYAIETTNLGQSRYYGVEFAYAVTPRGAGLTFNLQGSLQRAYTYNLPAGFYNSPFSGPNSINNNLIPNVNYTGAYGPARVPYSQGFASIGWRGEHGHRIAFNATYNGPNNPYYRPPFFVFDANGGFNISKNASLNLALSNLTNVYSNNVFYQTDYVVVPWAVADPQGHTGQSQTPSSVGGRILTGSLTIHVGGR
jgi:outer membrane receptor for ferrienterochelin and colicin